LFNAPVIDSTAELELRGLFIFGSLVETGTILPKKTAANGIHAWSGKRSIFLEND
jgi:hypothetical protein